MGRHSAPEPRRGRHALPGQGRFLSWAVALALVAALVGGGVWAWRAADGDEQPVAGEQSEDCPESPLRIATTNEMRVPLGSLVSQGNSTDCVRFVVDTATPLAVANAVHGNDPLRPAVWVPDSPLWARESGLSGLQQGPTIATSPTVVAVPQSLRGANVSGTQPWKTILERTGGRFGMDNPADDTPALMSLKGVAESYGGSAAGRQQLTGLVVRMSHSDNASSTMLTDADDPKKARAFPTSEQAVAAYNTEHTGSKLSVVVPKEGVAQLRYPVLRIPGSPGGDDAAYERFTKLVTSPLARTIMRNSGFRVQGETTPTVQGAPVSLPSSTPDPSAQDLSALLTAWNKAARESRMLVVLDVSGSMLRKAPKGDSRINLARKAGAVGLQTLPQSTEMGLWVFSTAQQGKRDYREVLPMRRLDSTVGGSSQASMLGAALDTMPSEVRGDTGLYDTVLAAYREAQRNYNPGRENSVVVVTDGANEDTTGGISLDGLLGELRRLQGNGKPVSVVLVGVGPSTNLDAMRKIAQATGGSAQVAENPDDMVGIFLKAVESREG